MRAIAKVGNYSMIVDDSTETGRMNLIHASDYEPHIFNEMKRLIPGSKCFYDIGSNYGIHTLNAKRLNPHIQIVSAEVNPRTAQCLLRTIVENNLAGIMVLPISISSNSKIVALDLNDRSDSNIACHPIDEMLNDAVLAQAFPLDFFNLPVPDVVKIDVEGFELFVLLGAGRLFAFRPVILFEYFPDALLQNKCEPIALLSWFTDRNYSLTVLDHSPGIRKTFVNPNECRDYIAQVDPRITDIMAEPR